MIRSNQNIIYLYSFIYLFIAVHPFPAPENKVAKTSNAWERLQAQFSSLHSDVICNFKQ